MEMELWNLFQSARAPNATLILSVIIGIWITARFSSVARENNAPILMKGIISVFALAMASFNWFVFTITTNNSIIAANAMQALKDSGETISPIAEMFISQNAGDLATTPNMVGMAIVISALLIALLPLWLKGE
ncbi:hypothetical protein OAD71_05490 [Gammaproteobacteria bacterium]|nr:hypothetical protein [Gammaproteobacteria bacterium]MDB9947694.1 hypothetical protein [Gammaproteobacteria bacterium]